MSAQRWVVIPDTQAPFNDKRATQAIVDFIRRVKPDGLLCVGDEIDLPSVSRWESGTATEFSRSLKRDVDITNQIMSSFRQALGKSKPFHISRSNHGDRLKNYVIRKAPALHEYVNDDEMLDIPRLVGYDKLGITYHRKPFEFTPGWVLCHGDEGNISPIAGRTATNLAVNKFGKSVVCGHCFDDQTQILTPQGWVSHDKLDDTSVVLTMNKATGKGEWQQVEAVYRYTDFDELIHVDAAGLNLAVTDGHGLVIHHRYTGERSYPTAGEAYGQEVVIPLALEHDEESLPISDDEIRFIAWVMAEGNVSDRGYVRIAQSDTPKGGTRDLELVLDALGYDYSKTLRYTGGTTAHGTYRNYDAYRYGFHGPASADLIRKYLDGTSKNPNRNLAGMNSAQAAVFIDEYVKADGSVNSASVNSVQVNSKDVEKIDFLQELAVRCGRRSSTSKRDGGHYTLTINTRGQVRTNRKSWSVQPYDGVVWCVTVPNGTLVVRRGGNTAITQNTHRLGQSTHTTSLDGRVTGSLTGLEIGNVMDLRQAHYMRAHSANWQQGCGFVEADGKRTAALPLPIIDGRVVMP